MQNNRYDQISILRIFMIISTPEDVRKNVNFVRGTIFRLDWEGTGRQVSWVVKKSFRLTKLKIEDEIDNMQTQNWISYNEIEILKFCLVNTSL